MADELTGADALMRTLVDAGVDVCFMNPGTSEMHFVAALDRVPAMRGVLTLFEGVATGAADGFGRIAGRPAAALLHLGPGLANGLANLHNARRARTPLVTVVGEHATFHRDLDAPLHSDIAALAGPVSGWVRTSAGVAGLGADASAAVEAALTPPGGVATLIVPADLSWSPGGSVGSPAPVTPFATVDAAVVASAAKALRTSRAALLLGGRALRGPALRAAARVAAATGARVLCETFPARLERGAGLPAFERLAYLPELAMKQLADLETLVLVGAAEPVTFFGYPDTPSRPAPAGCVPYVLAGSGDDAALALSALADEVGAPADPDLPPVERPSAPTGSLDAASFAAAIGATLPENAIIVDEANTSGLAIPAATAGAPRHDLLALTGGSIGQGPPVAVGAAIADAARPVVNLQADGSALYTMQAWWTQAREGLDVTTVLLNNRSYAILHYELAKVGATAGGERAKAMLDLTDPTPDYVHLARGLGLTAGRARTADDLVNLLRRAFQEPGPHLIEAVL
ncbi:acetolactate synthase large subunit [Virgisporangium ochraceum]|uniref:Acetolactate synthase I/II/III large subunit n=1 Tax=Virgisporangium ochraceum TaxID=65505 RepID=A0A8J3ZTV9_9ACTN|nr:acetolactate synthase large subunit [Virgisporangium ochraceum]GIJ68902.1 acetolactate synthase I/II/III large subunit [Virgisporangium ochraceum]